MKTWIINKNSIRPEHFLLVLLNLPTFLRTTTHHLDRPPLVLLSPFHFLATSAPINFDSCFHLSRHVIHDKEKLPRLHSRAFERALNRIFFSSNNVRRKSKVRQMGRRYSHGGCASDIQNKFRICNQDIHIVFTIYSYSHYIHSHYIHKFTEYYQNIIRLLSKYQNIFTEYYQIIKTLSDYQNIHIHNIFIHIIFTNSYSHYIHRLFIFTECIHLSTYSYSQMRVYSI